jgi:LacI family transcriptional regulator
MRPTTKDLAKAAGVSLATVDRVLNERPNVSARTVKKVQDAIERTGFVRNIAAVNLARNRTYRFRFVLPEKGDQYLKELLREIAAAGISLKSDLVSVDIAQVAIEDPHAIANYLSPLGPDQIDGVAIMAPESPQVRDAMGRLHERGIKVVQFLSGQENLQSLDFVGIDNNAAGATAGRIMGRFCGDRSGKIVIVAETILAQDSIKRRLGFDRVINRCFPGLRSLPTLETHSDPARAERIVKNIFAHNPDIVGVYIISSEARVPLQAIARFADLKKLVVVAHERTPFSEQALRDEKVDAIIAQNPGHAVRSAIRILRARMDHREPISAQERMRIEILLSENL